MVHNILETREKVEQALKRLATAQVSGELYMEYLYLVKKVMSIYEKYGEALDSEDEERILEYADQIICKIELERKEGILKLQG